MDKPLSPEPPRAARSPFPADRCRGFVQVRPLSAIHHNTRSRTADVPLRGASNGLTRGQIAWFFGEDACSI